MRVTKIRHLEDCSDGSLVKSLLKTWCNNIKGRVRAGSRPKRLSSRNRPRPRPWLPAQKSDSGLTAEEKKEVKELKKRDAEVRQHEYAHLAAAGPHALGGPTYEFETGPDGQRYTIGGEVEIDTSPVPNDPAATIEKAKTIRKAALAPADPSGQDRRVAAQAAQMEAKARQELAAEAAEEQTSYYSPAGQKQPFASQPAIFDVIL